MRRRVALCLSICLVALAALAAPDGASARFSLYSWNAKLTNSWTTGTPSMQPGQEFYTELTIKNIGSAEWDKNDSGVKAEAEKCNVVTNECTRLTIDEVPDTVYPNRSYTLKYNDRAASQPGIYRVSWWLTLPDNVTQWGKKSLTYTIARPKYAIINPASGKALDVYNNGNQDGTNVQIWEGNGSGAQQWYLISLGQNYYKIVNASSGKALDVSGAGTADGTNVQIWGDNGGVAQKWQMIASGDDTVMFVNPNSGKALDVSWAQTVNGANVHIWPVNYGAAQEWRVIRVD